MITLARRKSAVCSERLVLGVPCLSNPQHKMKSICHAQGTTWQGSRNSRYWQISCAKLAKSERC